MKRHYSCDDVLDGYDKIKTRKLVAKKARIKKLRSLNAKIKDIKNLELRSKSVNVEKELTIPVSDVNSAVPRAGDVIVDKTTKQLFYSEGTRWNLAGTWQGKRDIVVDKNGSGDFTSIQAAVNSLRGTVLEELVTVNIKPGTYEEGILSVADVNFAPIGRNVANVMIMGDTRSHVGVSYTDKFESVLTGKIVSIKLEPQLITIDSENLDLTTLNIVEGDKVKISTTTSTSGDGIIKSVTPNTLILSNVLSDELVAFSETVGTTVTFIPNVQIKVTNFEITASIVTFSGVWFDTNPFQGEDEGNRIRDNAIMYANNIVITGPPLDGAAEVTFVSNASNFVHFVSSLLYMTTSVGFSGLELGNSFLRTVASSTVHGWTNFNDGCHGRLSGNFVGTLRAEEMSYVTISGGILPFSGTFRNFPAIEVNKNSEVDSLFGLTIHNTPDVNIKVDNGSLFCGSIEFVDPIKDATYFLATNGSNIIIPEDKYTGLDDTNAPKNVYVAKDNSYISASTPHPDLPVPSEAAYTAINFSSIRAPDNPADRWPGPVITEVGGQVLP